MNTDYQKQAIDFLNATSTSFEAKFKTHDFYFADDKEQRDIFRVTLKNKLHTYRFNFGQSISKSTGDGQNKPTPYDVLACLEKYEVTTFEDFCINYGYDNDSRKAYKIYKAVLREWKNIEKLFTPEQIETLQEIS